MKTQFKSLFPYFGGKSAIAGEVWTALGEVDNYIEPFFGSGAVLFLRPEPGGGVETVNDYDGFVANFWRALKCAPDETLSYLDWPVNEVDLEARHRWLVTQPRKSEFLARMQHDPDFFCAKTAGWWCWGLCQWIGGGWCAGEYFGPGAPNNHEHGTCNKAANRPHLGAAGQGVHRKLPHLGNAGTGVHRKLPHLGDAGTGVHRKLPHLGTAGACEIQTEYLRKQISSFAARLRHVRVCCGDWLRICKSPTTTTKHGRTGIFFDPPYSADAGRDNAIYRCEDLSVAHRVREYCIERGGDPQMRIVLAGYEGEHNELERRGWRVHAWAAQGGYGNMQKKNGGSGAANRKRERIWLSPHCIADESDCLIFED